MHRVAVQEAVARIRRHRVLRAVREPGRRPLGLRRRVGGTLVRRSTALLSPRQAGDPAIKYVRYRADHSYVKRGGRPAAGGRRLGYSASGANAPAANRLGVD